MTAVNYKAFERERELDNLLSQSRRRLEYLDFINPVNGADEKYAFFDAIRKGERYEPKFNYYVTPQQQQELNTAQKVLESIELSGYEGVYANIFLTEVDVQKKLLAFIRGIGSDDLIQTLGSKLFGELDQKTLDYAKRRINSTSGSFLPESEEYVSVSEVELMVREELKKVGAQGWRFGFHDSINVPSVVLAHKSQVLFEKRDMYSKSLVDMLLAHEIRGHVAQSIGSMESPLVLLQNGTGMYELFFEAFALENESVVNDRMERRISLYYYAISCAKDSSLYDTYMALKQLTLPDDEAYAIASRVKRGLSDTSKIGTWMKDKIYLEGLLKYRGLSKEDRECVAHAKFGPELLQSVRQIIG